MLEALEARAALENGQLARTRGLRTRPRAEQSQSGLPMFGDNSRSAAPAAELFDASRHHKTVINSIRAHLAEFGIVAPVSRNGVEQLLEVVAYRMSTRYRDGSGRR